MFYEIFSCTNGDCIPRVHCGFHRRSWPYLQRKNASLSGTAGCAVGVPFKLAVPPFQGLMVRPKNFTQGCALGFHISPFQGSFAGYLLKIRQRLLNPVTRYWLRSSRSDMSFAVWREGW
jgi:hypothetical protein